MMSLKVNIRAFFATAKDLFVLTAFFPHFIFGQVDSSDEKHYIAKEVADSSLNEMEKSEWQFPFKDYHRKYTYRLTKKGDKVTIAYFKDKKMMEEIIAATKSGSEEKLQALLEKYIANFSIQNFYRNADLVWELAQLYEKKGWTDRAKSLYRLVLKHHNRDLREEILQYFEYKQYYDTLTALDKDYYVPLDYYYELVEYRRQIDTLRPPKSVLENMGTDINQKNVPDYGPSLNSSDDILIYTKRKIDNSSLSTKPRYNEDLYFTTGMDHYWDEGQKFDTPINSMCNEGSALLAPSGRTLYFSRCITSDEHNDCLDCMGVCDLYVSELKADSTWSQPKNMGPNINTDAWESQPTLSHTGDTLYFASDRKGGFGLSDIWYTVKDKNGNWGPAKNMGPIINTRHQEMSPFYHPKFHVFYFSSSGHLFNFHDTEHKMREPTLDLYKSHLIQGKWQEPKNIGPLVNGKGHENYFTIDSKSQHLYYARTEKGKELKNPAMTDLFSFPLPMEAQPTATIKLKGTLVDGETGDPLDAIVSIIDLNTGIEVAPKNVRKDGTYEFDLIDDKDYLLVIQGDEFFRIERLFHLDGDTTINSKATMIRNKKFKFTSVVFENGKADILPEMEADLKKVIDFLVDNPKFDLTISGHTDHDGNKEANTKLSQRRADAIKVYIEDKGYIESDRVKAIGYGDSKPIVEPEVTEEDKKKNRRVEFEIYYSKRKSEFSDDDFKWDGEVDDGDGEW